MVYSRKTGLLYGVAVDQGSGLASALKTARGTSAQPDDLFTFKRLLTTYLSPHASSVLVDAAFGRDLLPHIHTDCQPMLAYEADVYHISDTDRITVLPDNLKVADYPELGVKTLKFFMYYAPYDKEEIVRKKQHIVRKIGEQCVQHNIQFLFEPIVYDPKIADESSKTYFQARPNLVTTAIQHFRSPEYHIDILKVEPPVHFAHLDDVNYAKDAFMRVSDTAGDIPLVYLSAGVSFDTFAQGLEFVKSAQIPFRGFVCGRAIWSELVSVFGEQDIEGAEHWVQTEGVCRLQTLKDIIT